MVKNTLICILKNSISIFGVQFQYLNIIFDYLNLTQTIMGEAFFYMEYQFISKLHEKRNVKIFHENPAISVHERYLNSSQ